MSSVAIGVTANPMGYQYPLLYTVDRISRYSRRRVQRESLCSTRNTSLSGPIVTVQDYKCTRHSWQAEKQRWKCQGASPGSRLARGGKQRYMSLDRPDIRRHQVQMLQTPASFLDGAPFQKLNQNSAPQSYARGTPTHRACGTCLALQGVTLTFSEFRGRCSSRPCAQLKRCRPPLESSQAASCLPDPLGLSRFPTSTHAAPYKRGFFTNKQNTGGEGGRN